MFHIAKMARDGADDRLVGECPAESVIPEAGGGDRRSRWAEFGRFLIEEHSKKQVIVEQQLLGHARSGSSDDTRLTSDP